jgi:iron complex transport system substrate-binding protein
MRIRFTAAVANTAAALLVMTGCASSTPESDTDSSAGTGNTVETMFGAIETPAASDDLKVVALGWSDAEMALALGVVPIAVYDWQGFGAETKGVGPWAPSAT